MRKLAILTTFALVLAAASVAVAQDKLSQNVGGRVNSAVSESSLQLALENKKVQVSADGYIKALSNIVNDSSDAIGYAFAINGKVNSSDVYASSALFKKLWPKLLKATAIEAVAEMQQDRRYDPVSRNDVRKFLAEPEKAQASEKDVTSRTRMVTRETGDDVFFETRDAAARDVWVHRNYIRKN